jgi:hypothetical protein
MYTFQDYVKQATDEKKLMKFCRNAIADHKASAAYKTALAAKEYDRHRNVTIKEFQKLLYTVTGQAIPDNFSANYKLASNFFHRFTSQQVQFLLGNGVQWGSPETAEKLGDTFETRLQKGAKKALVTSCAFLFWNVNHIEVYDILNFVPLYDEETGALRAGIRFWQISEVKPLRARLFEEDGYTELIWRKGKGEIIKPKRAYKITTVTTEAGGTDIVDGQNYSGFPVIPLWANEAHQSELVGIREQIDAYDLIKSGFCNTVDEASFVYWAIQNGGGMTDMDLARFVERMKTVHAAVVNDTQAKAEAHSIEAPYASRETLLTRLRKDLYEDYQALDVKELASGSVTATQIWAAYEDLNSKADEFEFCVIDAIQRLLEIVGIEDDPTFTRSILVNKVEEVQTVLSAATHLSNEYVTRKVLAILGDGDRADEVLAQIAGDTMGVLTLDQHSEGVSTDLQGEE